MIDLKEKFVELADANRAVLTAPEEKKEELMAEVKRISDEIYYIIKLNDLSED